MLRIISAYVGVFLLPFILGWGMRRERLSSMKLETENSFPKHYNRRDIDISWNSAYTQAQRRRY